MKRIFKSILFGGIFSGLMLSFTSGNNPSRVSTERNTNFTFKNDSHYIINADTFHFLSIEDDSNAVDFLSSPNVVFWMRDIMLSADSFLVVNQTTRQVIDVVHKDAIQKIDRSQNLTSLGSLYAMKHSVPSNHKIKFVRGRKEFFNYAVVGPKLKIANSVFESVGVNPMVSQLLLLIESPSNHKGVSHSGAAGHFQIMPSVARKYGLRISKGVDDRLIFSKSAYAAARLVKEYCVPQAKRICIKNNIEFNTDALWFNLLVLHIYNAGAGTVATAVKHNENGIDGNDLIKRLWHTNVGAFQNSSQNYSQVCLASYLGYKEFLKSNIRK
jgi:hypothetical protein